MKDYWVERYKREGRKMFATGGKQEKLLEISKNNLSHLFAEAGINKVKNLIDYGCGYGRLEPFLHEYAEHIIGVDLLMGIVDFDVYDFVTYISTEEFFKKDFNVDVIVTYTVMQHVVSKNDFYKIMEKFYKSLKNGGYYIGVEHINPHFKVPPYMNNFSVEDYEKAFGKKILYKTEMLTYEKGHPHIGFIFKKE